jgi:hypothetical protein
MDGGKGTGSQGRGMTHTAAAAACGPHQSANSNSQGSCAVCQHSHTRSPRTHTHTLLSLYVVSRTMCPNTLVPMHHTVLHAAVTACLSTASTHTNAKGQLLRTHNSYHHLHTHTACEPTGRAPSWHQKRCTLCMQGGCVYFNTTKAVAATHKHRRRCSPHGQQHTQQLQG